MEWAHHSLNNLQFQEKTIGAHSSQAVLLRLRKHLSQSSKSVNFFPYTYLEGNVKNIADHSFTQRSLSKGWRMCKKY